jgi:hypothetical protein
MIPEIKLEGTNMTMVITTTGFYYFSYETCVAYKSLGGVGIRRERSYSNTTTKHLSKFGAKGWEKVNDAEFERIAGGN